MKYFMILALLSVFGCASHRCDKDDQQCLEQVEREWRMENGTANRSR